MIKKFPLIGFFCLLVLLLLFSCQKEKTAVVETVEGVQVIHNLKEPAPQKGAPSKITFEEELSIGEVKGREEYMFSIIRGVAVDDLDRIYIGDYRNANVRVFDATGGYLFTIGKEGQGPKKINPFHPVFYFQIDKDDNIVYGFPETYEIQVLNPEGEILKRIFKDYDPVEISEEEKVEASKEYPKEFDFRVVFLKHYPPFRTFSVDDEGRIIVQAWDRHENKLRYVYDVFDPEGYYVAKFNLETRPFLWKKGKMYGIAEDEEGYQSVKRFRVIWE